MIHKRFQVPSLSVLGLLLGGVLRIMAFVFQWPLPLIVISSLLLYMTITWLVVFELFPIFLEPFYQLRKRFPRRYSFFVILLALFALFQIIAQLIPSSPMRDNVTILAFLSFLSSIVWFLSVYAIGSFTPLIKRMKRQPREVEKVTFSDILTSMAIIMAPTIALSFFFAPPGLEGVRVTPYTIFLSSLLTNLFIVAYLYLFVIRPRVFTWRQLGVKRVDREDLGRSMLLFLLVVTVIAILQAFLQRIGAPLNQYAFASKDGGVLALVMTVFITPFVEELYFRGFLFKGLLLHNKLWVSYIVSSGLFALLHPPALVMAEVFLIGILLAYVVRESKSIWPAVLIHALNNALVFGYLIYKP